jgi:hypothetical protein
MLNWKCFLTAPLPYKWEPLLVTDIPELNPVMWRRETHIMQVRIANTSATYSESNKYEYTVTWMFRIVNQLLDETQVLQCWIFIGVVTWAILNLRCWNLEMDVDAIPLIPRCSLLTKFFPVLYSSITLFRRNDRYVCGNYFLNLHCNNLHYNMRWSFSKLVHRFGVSGSSKSHFHP